MTTTTPESRGLIAYVAYGRLLDGGARPLTRPAFASLRTHEQDAWVAAAGRVWSLATEGRTRRDVLDVSLAPAPTGCDPDAWAAAAGVLWDLAVTGRATI